MLKRFIGLSITPLCSSEFVSHPCPEPDIEFHLVNLQFNMYIMSRFHYY